MPLPAQFEHGVMPLVHLDHFVATSICGVDVMPKSNARPSARTSLNLSE
jgi:hypothetical protein